MIVALVIYALISPDTWQLTFKEVRANFKDFTSCEVVASAINQDNTTNDVAVCLTNNNSQRRSWLQ